LLIVQSSVYNNVIFWTVKRPFVFCSSYRRRKLIGYVAVAAMPIAAIKKYTPAFMLKNESSVLPFISKIPETNGNAILNSVHIISDMAAHLHSQHLQTKT
jgi:hypothetical protein